MFNINGKVWRILLVSPYHPMLKAPNGTFTIGSCNDETKTIYIADDLEA